ncbi:MAG: prepilin-type N-terminal cleavage/methylation domain-containing protein, partial [bacterium]|nr:prepilin-type N-terminal cleavage/methylation domain-containing protein [bacterium]
MDERGFTLIELLVSAGIAIALLALIAGIITSQGDTFSRQIVLGQMQANGRDAVDFLSRSIQNAGYNISRG